MSQSWFEKKQEDKERIPEFNANFFAVTIEDISILKSFGYEITNLRLVEGNSLEALKDNCFKTGCQAVIGLRETYISDRFGTSKMRYYGTGIRYVRKNKENSLEKLAEQTLLGAEE